MTHRFVNSDDFSLITANTGAITDKNLFAYCDNNPVMRADTGGDYWETAFDIAGLVADTIDIAANPANLWAWGALAADVACLVLPGVSGGGGIVRFVASSDNILEAAKYVDDIVDVDKAISTTKEIGRELHKLYDPIGDVVGDAGKSLNGSLKNFNSKLRPDGWDSANRIIYELKPYNRQSFLRAVKQTDKYAKTIGGKTTIVIDMYLR